MDKVEVKTVLSEYLPVAFPLKIYMLKLKTVKVDNVNLSPGLKALRSC
jgi:hypothetical protein